MRRVLLLLFVALPLLLLAQAPKEIDPLAMSPEEAKTKGIKLIECTTADYRDGEKKSFYEVERASFYENGYAHQYQFEDFKEGRLAEEQININKYLFKGDSIKEKYFEEFTSGIYYGKTLEYEEGRLVETKAEGVMRKGKTTKYEYYPNGKIAKKIYISRYAAVEEYLYEGEQLMKILYFYDEDDEEPETVTQYSYSNDGKIKEILEVRLEDQDTINWIVYDEEERISSITEQRTMQGNSFSPNEPYRYEEKLFYSPEGNLQSKKFLLPAMFQPHPHPDSLIWWEVTYKYEGDQMISFDSAGVRYHIEYSDFEEVAKITGTIIGKGDTIFTEENFYNDQQQLIEVKNWNFLEQKGFQWRYAYEGENRVMEDYFIFAPTERCTTKHEYNGEQRRLVLTKYCGINSRRLPGDIPMEVIDAYFDPQGNLVKETVKYGDRDGSLTVSYIDSFYYENGQLKQFLKDEFRGGQALNFDETYIYDANGLLTNVFGGYKGDTLLYKTYFYENKKLVSAVEKKYSLRRDQKYLVDRLLIQFNAQGQMTEKKVFKKEEAPDEEYDSRYLFAYYENGLLKQKSYFSKLYDEIMENRKTYTYTFFPK